MSSDNAGAPASSEIGVQDRAAALESTSAFLRELGPNEDDWLQRLRHADLRCLHDSGESIIIRASKDLEHVIVRLRNPAHRARTFSLERRYQLYRRMCEANPMLEPRFPRLLRFEPRVPCLFEEFVEAEPLLFADAGELLQAVETIRTINHTPVTPDLHRLLHRRSEESGLGWYLPKWAFRLASTVRRARANRRAPRDVERSCRLAARAAGALWLWRVEYPQRLTFHFDGAHPGNFLRRSGGDIVVFDLDRASVRRDPTFTLARFLASVCRDQPDPLSLFRFGVAAYLDHTQRPDFLELALRRWLEQEVSGLLWVISEAAAGSGSLPEEDFDLRYRLIETLLREPLAPAALTRSRRGPRRAPGSRADAP